MELEDFLQSEVAIAAAASAVIFSPQVRGVLRRGAVYGLAGALMAGDALSTFARGVGQGIGQGARQVTSSAAGAVQQARGDAKTAEPAGGEPL
ncbi:MAG: hypothetical protein PVSMB4_10780 [Ktedonobacterales bacterium]